MKNLPAFRDMPTPVKISALEQERTEGTEISKPAQTRVHCGAQISRLDPLAERPRPRGKFRASLRSLRFLLFPILHMAITVGLLLLYPASAHRRSALDQSLQQWFGNCSGQVRRRVPDGASYAANVEFDSATTGFLTGITQRSNIRARGWLCGPTVTTRRGMAKILPMRSLWTVAATSS